MKSINLKVLYATLVAGEQKFMTNLFLTWLEGRVKKAEKKLRKEAVRVNRVDLLSAETTSMWGTIVPCKVTNSRWLQEGVSGVNSAEFDILLDKKEKVLFIFEGLSLEDKQEFGYPKYPDEDKKGVALAMSKFQHEVGKYLDALKGKEVIKGETLIDAFGVVWRNGYSNQRLRFVDFAILPAPFNEGGFFVQLGFMLIAPRTEKKLRGKGVKATLVPLSTLDYRIEEGQKDDWVILHSMSGLKGKAWMLEAFGNAYPGAILDMERAEMHVPLKSGDGYQTFSLEKADENGDWIPSIVQKWANKHSVKEVHSFVYARKEWEFIEAIDKAEWAAHMTDEYRVGHPEYDVISVEEIDKDSVRLTVKIEVLHCQLPVNIEISLPEESSSKSALTPEMLSVMALVSRPIADAMVEGKAFAKQRQAVLACANMGLNKIPAGVTPEIVNLPEDKLKETDLTVSDADFLMGLDKLYPNGVVFFLNGKNYHYVKFGALSRISTFLGGNADGVSRDVALFFRWLIANQGDPLMMKVLRRKYMLFIKSLKGFLTKQLESKKLRKRIVTPPKGSLLMGKIRTVAWPCLSYDGKLGVDAVPKFAMSPFDDLLRDMAKHPDTGRIEGRFLDENGKFNPWLMQGAVISGSRTPMVMPGFVELVITTNAAPGTVYTLMHVWAMLNEGDSDGDGVGLTPVFHYGADRDMAIKVNKSVMSFAGYAAVYGQDVSQWPCAEFPSWWDSITKKAILVEPGSEAANKQLKAKILPVVRKANYLEFYQNTRNVRQHYIGAVSTAYDLCVIATNMALQGCYSDHLPTQRMWEITANVCWRLVYEGVGLSGYSEGAAKFFTLLRCSGYMTHAKWDGEGQLVKIKSTMLEESIPYMLKSSLGGIQLSDKTVECLMYAHALLQHKKDLMKKSKTDAVHNRLERNQHHDKNAAIMGMLRMISQGVDATLSEQSGLDDWEQGEHEGISITQIFLEGKLYESIACPWQAEAARKTALILKNLT